MSGKIIDDIDYCLNHCPYADFGDCPGQCDIIKRASGHAANAAALTARSDPERFKRSREQGRKMLLAGARKHEIAAKLQVSYSTVQSWEKNLRKSGMLQPGSVGATAAR